MSNPRLGSVLLLMAVTAAGLGVGACTSSEPTPVVSSPQNLQGSPPPANAKVLSFKGDVVPVLRQHCASCHSPAGSLTEHAWWFKADGSPDHKNIKDHAGLMIRYIKEGKMPVGKPNSLSAEEIGILEQWRQAGAPNN